MKCALQMSAGEFLCSPNFWPGFNKAVANLVKGVHMQSVIPHNFARPLVGEGVVFDKMYNVSLYSPGRLASKFVLD